MGGRALSTFTGEGGRAAIGVDKAVARVNPTGPEAGRIALNLYTSIYNKIESMRTRGVFMKMRAKRVRQWKGKKKAECGPNDGLCARSCK
jgi:hypothetical protein